MKVGDMVEVSGIEKRIELIGVKNGKTILFCSSNGEIAVHDPVSVKILPEPKPPQKKG